MSETQLERSVLEAKEREELFAIADALGAKPGARAKKADLVTQILRATGIEPEPSADAVEEKPRRTRARKAVAAPAVVAPTLLDVPAGGPAVDDPPVAFGARCWAELVAEGAGGALSPRAAVPARGAVRVDANGNNDVRPRLPRSPRPSTRSDSNGSSRRPVPAERPSDTYGIVDTESTLVAPSESLADEERVTEDDNQSGQAGAGSAGVSAGARPFDSEPGNRRNRRRRGRERFERGDRDLPGQAAEGQFSGDPVPVTGYLDLRDEGYGFLRTSGFLSGPGDVYVSISQVRRFALRKGDYLEGAARPAGGNEKYPALLRIDTVTGMTPEEARDRPRFENLTPLFPDQKLRLEVPGDSANMTARIVDLIAPIGKGQRGMIVSPPKAGKTTILKQIAHSIEANNPDVQLIVLLVDERPEEVTDMR